MVTLAPGIILAAMINSDMWAAAFLAGLLIGLGTVMKVFPLLSFGAVIVLSIRSGR